MQDGKIEENEIGTFTLLSYLDGVFDITYFSPVDNFEEYFLIVERLIKSIKISNQV